MNSKQTRSLIIRYSSLLVLGILSLKFSLFYKIFTLLTVYPVFYILSIFYPTAQLLSNNILSFEGFHAQISPACVAGAAYYFLLILNLTTPMKNKTRIKSIIFIFLMFLILNIIRILVFAGLLANGFQYFDFTHLFFWYFGSTLLVIVIWFLNVKIFNIKSIPVYTDFKLIIKEIKR